MSRADRRGAGALRLLVSLAFATLACGQTALTPAGADAAADGPSPDLVQAALNCRSTHADCFGVERGCDPETGEAWQQVAAPIFCQWDEGLSVCLCEGLMCATAHYRCAEGCRTDPRPWTAPDGGPTAVDGGVRFEGPEVGFIAGPLPTPWLGCAEFAAQSDAGTQD